MTVPFALNTVLALIVIAMAVWTVTARTAFAAVIGFMAFGALLAIVWTRLAAVDAALTEAALGAGVTGVMLLRAAAALSPLPHTARAPPVWQRWATGLVAAIAAGSLAMLVLMIEAPAPTLAPLAAASLAELGLGNPVSAVLIAYRAMDTLLEAVVVLLALIGVWSLAPDRSWGEPPRFPRPPADDSALVLLGQLLPPLGIVVGIYIFWVGKDAPGGKFQAGTILAAMWILAMMAHLTAPPRIDRPWLRGVLVVGPAVFLAVGFAGFIVPGTFLSYPPGLIKPLILAIEAAMTLSIAATLGLIVAGPSASPTETRPSPNGSAPS